MVGERALEINSFFVDVIVLLIRILIPVYYICCFDWTLSSWVHIISFSKFSAFISHCLHRNITERGSGFFFPSRFPSLISIFFILVNVLFSEGYRLESRLKLCSCFLWTFPVSYIWLVGTETTDSMVFFSNCSGQILVLSSGTTSYCSTNWRE